MASYPEFRLARLRQHYHQVQAALDREGLRAASRKVLTLPPDGPRRGFSEPGDRRMAGEPLWEFERRVRKLRRAVEAGKLDKAEQALQEAQRLARHLAGPRRRRWPASSSRRKVVYTLRRRLKAPA
jgi:hypothetical protein